VLELTVATACCDKEPTVVAQAAQQLTHFHPPTLALAPSITSFEFAA